MVGTQNSGEAVLAGFATLLLLSMLKMESITLGSRYAKGYILYQSCMRNVQFGEIAPPRISFDVLALTQKNTKLEFLHSSFQASRYSYSIVTTVAKTAT